MGKLSYIITAFLILAISTTTVNADFDKSKWAYTKDIRLEPFSLKKLAAFSIDNEIFDNSVKGLSDLRIIDSNGVEVPYKLTVESAEKSIQTYPVKITNLGSKTPEFTQLTLEIQRSGETHNSVTLQTTSINFRRQVEVEASSDSQNWFLIKKASDGAHIYDYSLDFKARNMTVDYPDSTYRYLRIKIIDNGEEALKINGATIFSRIHQGAREVFYSPKVEQREEKDLRTSHYILDLDARGIPTNKIMFTSQGENYNRKVSLEGSNDKVSWSNISNEDVIFNYNTPKFVGSKNTIDYAESNFRYLRLAIYNGDDKPVSLSGIKVSGVLRRVLFEAELNKKYNLYYGSDKARFPEYDLDKFIQYLDTSNPVNGLLGPQQKNPDFEGPGLAAVPLSERYPYLLAGVLAIMVLILGTIIARMAFAVKRGR